MSEQERLSNSTVANQIPTVFSGAVWFKSLLLHVKGISAEQALHPTPGRAPSAEDQSRHGLRRLELGRLRLTGAQGNGDQDVFSIRMAGSEAEWNGLKTEPERRTARVQQAVQTLGTRDGQKLNSLPNRLIRAAPHAGSVVQILEFTP